MYLFYISTNNTIATQIFQYKWSEIDLLPNAPPITVYHTTKSLTAAYAPAPNDASVYNIYVIYEDVLGEASILLGKGHRYKSSMTLSVESQRLTLESPLKPIPPGSKLSGPFGARTVDYNGNDNSLNTSEPAVEILCTTSVDNNYSLSAIFYADSIVESIPSCR